MSPGGPTREGHARLTRADIEDKLRSVKVELDRASARSRPTLLAVGAASAAALVVLAYALGRRRGRRRSTIVEVRRL
jgi:hypothetical protein